MEILVCVKQVPDADVEVKLNADNEILNSRLTIYVEYIAV